MNASLYLILTLVLAYIFYLITTIIVHAKHAHNLAEALVSRDKFKVLFLKLSVGILLFGVPIILNPHIFFSLISFPITLPVKYMGVWLVLLTFVSGISLLSAIKEKSKNSFMITSELPTEFTASYLPVRFVFLVLYELFFRGFLFYVALRYTNLTEAILINTFLYVLIHFRDSRKEILGSIPFGIILCLLTYYSNSIWPAVVMHISLAGFYESILLFYKPLKFRKT